MKIRQGCVSNSSSSSFVVCLPDNFNIRNIHIDIEKFQEEYGEDLTLEAIYEAMDIAIKTKGTWGETIGYDCFWVLQEILQDFKIAQLDTGPDMAQFVIMDKDQKNIAKKVLANED